MSQGQLDVVRLLRDMGAKSVRFSGGDSRDLVHVEFFAAAEPVDNSPSLPKHLDLGGPEMCPCTHDETEHSGGVCLFGCNVETCNPPKSDAQKATDAP